jgi:hypothetical protein
MVAPPRICPLTASWPAVRSGRRQPGRRQRQPIVPYDQPTLGGRVGLGLPEVGHRPVANLRLGEVSTTVLPIVWSGCDTSVRCRKIGHLPFRSCHSFCRKWRTAGHERYSIHRPGAARVLKQRGDTTLGDGANSDIDPLMAELTDAALAVAAPRPGESVLDIECETGDRPSSSELVCKLDEATHDDIGMRLRNTWLSSWAEFVRPSHTGRSQASRCCSLDVTSVT